MKKAIIFLCAVSLLVSMSGCKSKNTDSSSNEETTNTTITLTEKMIITTVVSTSDTEPETKVTTTAATVTTKAVTKPKVTEQTTAVTVTQPVSTTVVTQNEPADFSETTPITNSVESSVSISDTCTDTSEYPDDLMAAKPVIYLYPTKKTDIKVSLGFDGELTCTYPSYNNSWNVTASPDGTIFNKTDGKEYSYLFWEGISDTKYDLSTGFVVSGSDTASFLQEKLAYIGLTPKEYNEFIVYWLPKMQDNKYNLITFQGDDYTDSAKLEISPKPDSMLRVFMAYKALKEPIKIEEQELVPFERKGFCVIEWGGTIVS